MREVHKKENTMYSNYFMFKNKDSNLILENANKLGNWKEKLF